MDVMMNTSVTAHKRTKPMLGNRVDANGNVFTGDGSLGSGYASDRRRKRHHGVDPSWYLERATSERHFITIQGKMKHFLMVNEAGEYIDEFPRTPHFERGKHKLAPRW